MTYTGTCIDNLPRMRRLISVLAPLAAAALLAQSLPAAAAEATPTPPNAAAAATLPAGIPAPGSPADKNLTAWIDQVEADPNKFDQNLEENCVANGGDACSLSHAQIQRLPGEIEAMTKSIVEAVQGDKALNDEVTSDFTPGSAGEGGPEQTRAVGSAIRAVQGVKALISAVPRNPTIQRLVGDAKQIGEVADNVSRLAYAQMGVQGYMKKNGTIAAIAKVAIYSTPVVGDVFSLGEAIFDPSLTTAERVEGGVCATLSLIAATAAFAGGPVGFTVGATIAVGLAAYYTGKAIWGWIASGSEDWTQAPTTPQELYDAGAYLEWEAHTVTGNFVKSGSDDPSPGLDSEEQGPVTADVAMTIPATESGQTRTVSETLLVDSRWTDYNKHGQPVAYDFIPYGPYNVPQGLYVRSGTWDATNATITVAQDGSVKSGTCQGTVGDISPFYQCGPDATVRISNGHPAVVTVTYTYSLNDWFGSTPEIHDIEASLTVYTPQSRKVILDMPFQVALVGKAADPAVAQS